MLLNGFEVFYYVSIHLKPKPKPPITLPKVQQAFSRTAPQTVWPHLPRIHDIKSSKSLDKLSAIYAESPYATP